MLSSYPCLFQMYNRHGLQLKRASQHLKTLHEGIAIRPKLPNAALQACFELPGNPSFSTDPQKIWCLYGEKFKPSRDTRPIMNTKQHSGVLTNDIVQTLKYECSVVLYGKEALVSAYLHTPSWRTLIFISVDRSYFYTRVPPSDLVP